MRVWAALLLAASLVVLWYFVRGQVWGHGRLPPAVTRDGHFARVTLRPLLLFGAWSVLVLVLAGQAGAMRAFPAALEPVRAWVLGNFGDTLPLRDIAPALLAGAVIGALLSRLLARRGWETAFGDTRSVLPRARRELAWGAAMAVSAGVSEELFFRLLLPLLIAIVTGSAWAGVIAGVALFGAAHRYQGWRGVIATGAVGAMLALVYLMTGNIATAMALHIALDLNALVLRPVLSGRVRLF